MPSRFRPRVRSLASGLGQATGFDSSARFPTIYLFAAALSVRSRVSNPRPIALAPSNPCPESLSVGDLATSPAPDPRAHALWLTHCASLPFWQAPCTGSGRRAATAASRAAHERLSLYGAPLQPAAVLAAGERGWRAPASVWPVGPAEGRQRVVSARRLRPGSGRDLVPLAAGHGLGTGSSL